MLFRSVMTIEEDPVYLTEPFVITRTFVLDPRGNMEKWSSCEAVTEIERLEGSGIVPHYLPGESPGNTYMNKTYNIPQEAAMGYAETLYPEYRKKIQGSYKAPVSCGRYCCGWLSVASGSANPAPNIKCTIEASSVIGAER